MSNGIPELLLRDSGARAAGDRVPSYCIGLAGHGAVSERDSNRKPPRSGKLRSHAAHQAAHRTRAFARHRRPGRSVGSRTALRRQGGRPAAGDRHRTGRSGQPARRSRPGYSLHQTLRARLSFDVARCGAREILAPGFPAAVSQIARRILPRADAGSIFDGRADSPGIRVQSQSDLARQRSWTGAGDAGHRTPAQPETRNSAASAPPCCSRRIRI